MVDLNNENAIRKDVLLLQCEPLPVVRIAFVGLGKRGKQSFNHFMYIDGVEVKALCDINCDNLTEIQQMLFVHNKPSADLYSDFDDWRKICEREDIDLLYVCTDRGMHAEIAVYAMNHNKHVAVEVPAANTVEECWALVDTAEHTRRHCIMLENCCYDYDELAMLNLTQAGFFGEIIHVEGAYIHDLRFIDFATKTHYMDLWSMYGNPYPTHGLGPLCQLLNIHRGDKIESVVSVSSGQFNFPVFPEMDSNAYKLGNINTSILKTSKGKTIVLQHDVSSPRPYTRNYLLSGTRAFAHKRDELKVALSENPSEYISDNELNTLLTDNEHLFYKQIGELARKVGAHGGMDFIMDYRLIYCLQRGLPLDMDVYDAAEWSALVELTSLSVQNGSIPVTFPDFTRGRWNKVKGLQFSQ
ncbi:MAG: Gfo/Idh/MocA family oxidoreductase [Paludibacteraceae bacterium]|nr:Gfo/Idh/MocA family oxidoreductase [Paludibacteraceae bacterium]